MVTLGWDSDSLVVKHISNWNEKNFNYDGTAFEFSTISEKIDQLLTDGNLENKSIMIQDQKLEKESNATENHQNSSAETRLKKMDIWPSTSQEKDKEFFDTIDKNSKDRSDNISKFEPYAPSKSTFGYNDLGQCKIIYDKERSEYIYTISEPQLTEDGKRIKKKLEYLFRIHTDVDVSHMSFDEKKDHLVDILESIITSNKITIDSDVKQNVFYYIIRKFIGFGIIDILMKDNDIEDISCDGPDVPIFIFHRKFESLRTNVQFESSEELDGFVFKLAQICGKQLSIYEPIVDGRLPDGSRLQTTLAKTITKGSTFTIRRFNENPLTPINLIDNKTMTAKMAAYFWFLLEHGTSILFCGGTASGKTTLLNALSLFLPPAYKIVSAEDTREINLPHENWIAGTTRQGFISSGSESSREIDMFDLVKAALRQRPQVIIVGEVRGKEANTMFQAMATGHLSYSTMHANDMQTLIQRLENQPINLPRSLMVSLDLVVFIKSVKTLYGKAVRRINEVVEILKLDPDTNRLITVNPFSYSGPLEDSYKFHGNSKLLSDFTKLQGWSNDDLYKELKRREEILEWMKEQKIFGYKEVGKLVSDYTKDPEKFKQIMREYS